MKWDELIEKHGEQYRRSRPKRGQFVERYLKASDFSEVAEKCFMEEGAFSGKDTIYLAENFPSSDFIVLDLELETLKGTRHDRVYPVRGDAFRLPFSDRSIDITFHSGLIVLFDNENSERIIAEQLRVTSGLAFVFAHNKANFVDIFVSWARRKWLGLGLYQYRRFTLKKLEELCSIHGTLLESGYTDNMLLNFTRRRLPFLAGTLEKTFRVMPAWLFNEVFVVMAPDD